MKHIVSVNWVKKHVNELTVIACRFHLASPEKGLAEYKEHHIPGKLAEVGVHDDGMLDKLHRQPNY